MAPARFLVLDRPGWGGSDALPVTGASYRRTVADLLVRVLDALGLERVTVIGGSIGDVWALSLAQHHPERVVRVVLLGGGPLVDGVQPPGFIRLIASPLGALIVRLPVSPDRARSILRDSGHGPSLDAGRIPDAFIDWRVALSNETAAMRHERTMVRSILGRQGFRPGFAFDDDELRSIPTPVAMIYGTADRTGDLAMWERFTRLLPNGELHVADGAGHMPWFDDPAGVAGTIDQFLGRPAVGDQAGRSRSAGPT
jgi:4,5:9,10-diseco-3-hydroxy-5,9,17-trioxoandrosta-1(10),2-diene-4-oate hydrolase